MAESNLNVQLAPLLQTLLKQAIQVTAHDVHVRSRLRHSGLSGLLRFAQLLRLSASIGLRRGAIGYVLFSEPSALTAFKPGCRQRWI